MSEKLTEKNSFWLDYNNKIVSIDGINHRIKARTSKAIYPVKQTVLTVDLEPVNKNSKYYQEIKRQLGDDWTTDLLTSDISLQYKVLKQLGGIE